MKANQRGAKRRRNSILSPNDKAQFPASRLIPFAKISQLFLGSLTSLKNIRIHKHCPRTPGHNRNLVRTKIGGTVESARDISQTF